jgi:hypothetical protein
MSDRSETPSQEARRITAPISLRGSLQQTPAYQALWQLQARIAKKVYLVAVTLLVPKYLAQTFAIAGIFTAVARGKEAAAQKVKQSLANNSLPNDNANSVHYDSGH